MKNQHFFTYTYNVRFSLIADLQRSEFVRFVPGTGVIRRWPQAFLREHSVTAFNYTY